MDSKMSLIKSVLILCLLIVLSHTVAGEVATLSIATDNTWKSLDFENDGWTSNDYDDSWWEPTMERDWTELESGEPIWYPGNVEINPAYFRNVFMIDGVKILNGKLYVKTYGGDGTTYLYINDNPLDKITARRDETAAIDITPYIKPGKNVIAAKVDIPDTYYGPAWALIGTIRYDKTALGQPIT